MTHDPDKMLECLTRIGKWLTRYKMTRGGLISQPRSRIVQRSRPDRPHPDPETTTPT